MSYITLPSSPKWHIINYDNCDCQPDFQFSLSKKNEHNYYLKKLLKIIPLSNPRKTYLENCVTIKRNKL